MVSDNHYLTTLKRDGEEFYTSLIILTPESPEDLGRLYLIVPGLTGRVDLVGFPFCFFSVFFIYFVDKSSMTHSPTLSFTKDSCVLNGRRMMKVYGMCGTMSLTLLPLGSSDGLNSPTPILRSLLFYQSQVFCHMFSFNSRVSWDLWTSSKRDS